MDSERLNKIFRARKTALKMISDRGYIVNEK